MRPKDRVRKFRETRYPHQRSEGLTVRRSNGATKSLIRNRTEGEAPTHGA